MDWMFKLAKEESNNLNSLNFLSSFFAFVSPPLILK